MGKYELTLQIYVDFKWQDVGLVKIESKTDSLGYKAPSYFEYNFNYLDKYSEHLFKQNNHAVSLNYPLSFELFQSSYWSAFLLDIIPSGAARDFWLKKLNLPDGPTADIQLLQNGSFNPPGNIRIKPEQSLQFESHHGFTQQDIIENSTDFIEYAESMGAVVAGASGAQGVSPKLLMVQDTNNYWHADLSLADHNIKKHWLIKFSRHQKKIDQLILELEYKYHLIAKKLGLNVYGDYQFKENTLFIPRFDRHIEGEKIFHYGLESFTSALNVADFSTLHKADDFLTLINKFSTQAKHDIKEYLLRDFANICLGNTDNHGRNFAFLKTDKTITLSPLYDFAPMKLDPAMIPRATKWSHESGHIPNFKALSQQLELINFTKKEIHTFFKDCLLRLENLPTYLNQQKIDQRIQNRITAKFDPFMQTLNDWIKHET